MLSTGRLAFIPEAGCIIFYTLVLFCYLNNNSLLKHSSFLLNILNS